MAPPGAPVPFNKMTRPDPCQVGESCCLAALHWRPPPSHTISCLAPHLAYPTLSNQEVQTIPSPLQPSTRTLMISATLCQSSFLSFFLRCDRLLCGSSSDAFFDHVLQRNCPGPRPCHPLAQRSGLVILLELGLSAGHAKGYVASPATPVPFNKMTRPDPCQVGESCCLAALHWRPPPSHTISCLAPHLAYPTLSNQEAQTIPSPLQPSTRTLMISATLCQSSFLSFFLRCDRLLCGSSSDAFFDHVLQRNCPGPRPCHPLAQRSGLVILLGLGLSAGHAKGYVAPPGAPVPFNKMTRPDPCQVGESCCLAALHWRPPPSHTMSCLAPHLAYPTLSNQEIQTVPSPLQPSTRIVMISATLCQSSFFSFFLRCDRLLCGSSSDAFFDHVLQRNCPGPRPCHPLAQRSGLVILLGLVWAVCRARQGLCGAPGGPRSFQ